MPRFVDLSHIVADGMITYPGLPGPRISDHLSREGSRHHYESGTEFHIGRIEMVANTGTYLDTPFHRFADGYDLVGLPLDRVAEVEGVVVRVLEREAPAIGPEVFESLDVAGKAVLVHTGWDRHWGTDSYFEGHPHLTESAAEYLVENRARLVGIDSLNIDATDGGARPVHTVLLAAGIPIVEHLCGLSGLPETGFRFSAVPVMVAGLGTFPVRAYAAVG